MKKQLTSIESKWLLTQIRAVIDTGKPWEDETLHYPAGAIIGAVLSIKGMEKAKTDGDCDNGEGFSTNGWQWDWWQEFTHEGKRYTLSGSGFYGGHTFQLSDE